MTAIRFHRCIVAGALTALVCAIVTTLTVHARTREFTRSTTAVEIKSEHLTGRLPIGLLVDINVKVEAEGADPTALTGEGRHFASTGAHNYWPASGSTDGTIVTLSGVVIDSNAPYLIGSPVEVVGDASTGAITLTFGPLAAGPFAGHTLVFTGSGKVTVTTSDR